MVYNDPVNLSICCVKKISEDAFAGNQMIRHRRKRVSSAYEKTAKKKHFLPLPIRQQMLFPRRTSKTLFKIMLPAIKYHKRINPSRENFLKAKRTGRRYPLATCRGSRKRVSTPSARRHFFIWYGQPGITLHAKERIADLLPFGAQTSPAVASCAFLGSKVCL